MKIFTKTILAFAAVVAIAGNAFAGGVLTNTNQSAAFLRSIARGTSLDPDAVYYNPAGTAFMSNGWHIGLNNQMASQTRSTISTYAPFAMGAANSGMAKEFKGEVFSPVIPSVHLTWKHNRWAVMLGMGVNGGGGTIEYADGLASFERQFSVLPGAINQLGSAMGLSTSQYNMDMLLKGSSMTLAFNAGVSFRITDWLSAAAQIRFNTTSNGYEGHIKNIKVNPNLPAMPALGLNGQMMSASEFFTNIGALRPDLAAQAAQYAALTSDHILDVKQKGTSVSPVLALAIHKGKWDASIRYEFKMATELDIESAEVSAKDPVINGIFADGTKVKSETPALLAIAVSRHFGPVKVTAEWHNFFDKNAENSFSQAVQGNTNEILLGAEWSISDRWMISAGAQRTIYDLNTAYYSDMNFTNSAWCIGLGLAYKISDTVRLNAGYMPTIYDEVTSTGKASNIDFSDIYKRTSHAWGIGIDLKFGRD